jgi:rhodanese-related sulfurtransferase
MMKKLLSLSLLFLFSFFSGKAQNPVNWTNEQLLEAADLAAMLAVDKDLPVIYSVGPGAPIPHSVYIGMTNDSTHMDNLKKQVSKLPKNAAIVLYCGCCPFEHCPNVRPAIAALKELQFTNYKLLNLPKNLKADWIDKGYPVVKP